MNAAPVEPLLQGWPIRWVENTYAYRTTYGTIIRRRTRIIRRFTRSVLSKGLWGVERVLAVIGTRGPRCAVEALMDVLWCTYDPPPPISIGGRAIRRGAQRGESPCRGGSPGPKTPGGPGGADAEKRGKMASAMQAVSTVKAAVMMGGGGELGTPGTKSRENSRSEGDAVRYAAMVLTRLCK
eukprot:1185971-Prorocentrum_minimum.AAC.4